MTRSPGGCRTRVLGALVTLVVTLAGCSGGSPSTGGGPHSTAAHPVGTVRVLYAGSLVNLFTRQLVPAFQHASGAAVAGLPGGSVALAHEIDDGVHRADVFISAARSVNALLTGARHAHRERWYLTFAVAPLVIGYEPGDRFAAALAHQPWYDVVTRPGFRLGRTDPALDPKGELTVRALRAAAVRFHVASLATTVLAHAQVFPEEELIGRLDAGQLDAGFFYTIETVEQHLPTVRLGIHEQATFTVTVPTDAPNPGGGVAFVRYLLGAAGRRMLTAAGLQLSGPTLVGTRSAVPAGILALLPPTG